MLLKFATPKSRAGKKKRTILHLEFNKITTKPLALRHYFPSDLFIT